MLNGLITSFIMGINTLVFILILPMDFPTSPVFLSVNISHACYLTQLIFIGLTVKLVHDSLVPRGGTLPIPGVFQNKIKIFWTFGKFWSFASIIFVAFSITLQWRHDERDDVSNHQPHDCLLNRLSRRRSKKTSKLCVTGLCEGNSPETGEFPAQRASNAENVFIWWRHHDIWQTDLPPRTGAR